MIKFVTGRMIITSVPSGEAPLEVRKAWVGLEMPINCIHDFGCLGVLTGKPSEGQIRYWVSQDEALQILNKVHPDAATWWYQHGYPHFGNSFGFLENEIRVFGDPQELPREYRQFLGLLEVGVGASDHPSNQN